MDSVKINLEFTLQKNVPKHVVNLLKYLMRNIETPFHEDIERTREIPFFDCRQWNMIATGTSVHYTLDGTSKLIKEYDGIYIIFIKSSIRNKDNAIALFLDWMLPYIDSITDTYLGYSDDDKDDDIIHYLYNCRTKKIITKSMNVEHILKSE